MTDSTSVINFTRDEFAASMRAWLLGLADWVEQIFWTEALERTRATVAPHHPAELTAPGSAGHRMERSFILVRMLQAYDFATTGVWDTTSLEEFAHELDAFESALHLPLETHAGGRLVRPLDPGRIPGPQEMAERVLTHVRARLSLLRGDALTLAELAALAGLAEKTVRMAAHPRDPKRPITFKEGHNTFVRADDALRWLRTRADFRETVLLDAMVTTRSYPSPAELGAHCREMREGISLTVTELAERLAWGRALRQAYTQLEDSAPDFDPRPLTVLQLVQLGKLFGVPDIGEFTRNAATALVTRAIELDCAEALH